jgi:hypothetical protein
MTIEDKKDFILTHYNIDSISKILREFHSNNTKLQLLFDKWYETNGVTDYEDSNEGILLINLLYDITKNNPK